MGEVGKTQLARNYAEAYRGDYSAVFWFNSKNMDTLRRSFLTAAEGIKDKPSFKCRWPYTEEKGIKEAVEGVKEWLSMSRNTRWLLIFDNYDSPAELQVRRFFPAAQQGAIIVTTRISGLGWGQSISVEKSKSISDSLFILSYTSGRKVEKGKLAEPTRPPLFADKDRFRSQGSRS
jgi:hypothetical protein